MWYVENNRIDIRSFLTERFPTDPPMSNFNTIADKLKAQSIFANKVPPSQMDFPSVTGFFTTMAMFELEIRYVNNLPLYCMWLAY